LGLLVLALTTALIGASFARFLVPTVRMGIGTVAAPALVYGGVIQVLAGMWAFRKNHILAATLFSAYGGFLIAFGALFLPLFGLTTLFGANALAINHALGLLFLCWTISCGVLVPGALRTTMAQGAVVVCLFLSYLFLTIGELANANGPLLAIGGWVGIICALLAWYAALGGILQATGSPWQLPMGERGGASSTSAPQYDGEPAV
jgi:succinate-acetate transporter protein